MALPRGAVRPEVVSGGPKNEKDFASKEFFMANHDSAWKRMRQNVARSLRNASYRSKVKTVIKRYLSALDNKDPEAQSLLREVVSLVEKGVTKGIYHRNTASRTVSRLSSKLSAGS